MPQAVHCGICCHAPGSGKIPSVGEVYTRLLVCRGEGASPPHASQPGPSPDTPLSPAHSPEVMAAILAESVQVKLELGHKALLRTKHTKEGFTHDWTVYVRGPDGSNIYHFVDKVVFHLHESFPKPKRTIKEPPYSVSESGYGGFTLPIEIYFRNKEEPRKIRFEYDLFLHLENCPPVNHIRCEKLTFKNPTEEFRRKLIKAGGIGIPGPNDAPSLPREGQSTNGTTLPTPENKTFNDLFGTPFKADTSTKKPKPSSKEKTASKPSSMTAAMLSSGDSTPSSVTASTRDKPTTASGSKDKPTKRPIESPPPSKSSKKKKKEKDRDREKDTDKKEEKSKHKKHKKKDKKESKASGLLPRELSPQEKPIERATERSSDRPNQALKSPAKAPPGEKPSQALKSPTKAPLSDRPSQALKSPAKALTSERPSQALKSPAKAPPVERHSQALKSPATAPSSERPSQALKSPAKALPSGKAIPEYTKPKPTLTPFEGILSTGEQSDFEDMVTDIADDVSNGSSHSFSSLKQTGGSKPLVALYSTMMGSDNSLSDEDDGDILSPLRASPPALFQQSTHQVSHNQNSQIPVLEREKTDKPTSSSRKKGKSSKKSKSDKKSKESSREKESKERKEHELSEKENKLDNDNDDNDSGVEHGNPSTEVSHNTTCPNTEEKAPNGEYLVALLQLQRSLMTLTDRKVLQDVVRIIEDTGLFKISDATFDFDLCCLDAKTVKRLNEVISNASST